MEAKHVAVPWMLGMRKVEVYEPPRVAVCSTEDQPDPGKVLESNGAYRESPLLLPDASVSMLMRIYC